MIPIDDDLPTLHPPVVTWVLLALIAATWLFTQGAGLDQVALATSVCNYGMVPGELTGLAPVGTGVPFGHGLACVVDDQSINVLTPLTSMFLHGSWTHVLGNALFLWVFGNNIEDSMGPVRFGAFYILCGLIAAAAHVLIAPGSPVPTVGASGAISGVMGAYLLLYPHARIRMLFIFVIFFRIFRVPAWLVLLWWFLLQVVQGLPELSPLRPDISGGVAVWAHIGGFLAGMALVKLFENRRWVAERQRARVIAARGFGGR